jgi:hypothetical protein
LAYPLTLKNWFLLKEYKGRVDQEKAVFLLIYMEGITVGFDQSKLPLGEPFCDAYCLPGFNRNRERLLAFAFLDLCQQGEHFHPHIQNICADIEDVQRF